MDNRYALLGQDMLRLLRLGGYIQLLQEERLPEPDDVRSLVLQSLRDLQSASDWAQFRDRAIRAGRLVAFAVIVANYGLLGRLREGSVEEQRSALAELQVDTLLELVSDAVIAEQTIADRQLLRRAEAEGVSGAQLDLAKLLVNQKAELWTLLLALVGLDEREASVDLNGRDFRNKLTQVLLSLERTVKDLPEAGWLY